MLRSFSIFLAVLFMGASAQASLIGLEFSSELGITSEADGGGPFGPNFVSQNHAGSAIVGPGQEFSDHFGSSADFDEDGVYLTFSSSHATGWDFNGFRYLLLSPGVEILNVMLLDTSINGLTQANIIFTSEGFAVNAAGMENPIGSLYGFVELAITTTAVSDVPVPAAFVFMLTGIASVAAARRKKKAL